MIGSKVRVSMNERIGVEEGMKGRRIMLEY